MGRVHRGPQGHSSCSDQFDAIALGLCQQPALPLRRVSPLMERQINNLEIVSCPLLDILPKSVELPLPLQCSVELGTRGHELAEGIRDLRPQRLTNAGWFLLTGKRGVHKKEVDVAGLVSIATRCRAENRRVQRSRAPTRQFLSKTPPKLRPEPRQDECGASGDVMLIQLVNLVTPHHGRAHNALLDEAGETAPDTNLRPADGEFGDLTD